MITQTWLLFINHDFQTCIGECFSVRISDTDNIHDLKKKVVEENSKALDRANTTLIDLTVWRTKGEMILKSTSKRLGAILKSINIKDVIEVLSPGDNLVDLGLSDGEILLVQLPGTSKGSSCISTPPSTFSDCIRRPRTCSP